MKKIIILENNGGRLANQLWLYASIYAYCLEKKYTCENNSFFKYYHYFNIDKPKSWVRIFYYNNIRNCKLTTYIYAIYSKITKYLHKKNIITDRENTFFLSPDQPAEQWQEDLLTKIETSQNTVFYFCGWLFRTPKGLDKYRTEIRKFFKPKIEYLDKINNIIKPLRDARKYIVGVHIRHGDYKTWNGGIFYRSFEDVRTVLESYLENHKEASNVVFVLCSDEPINENVFMGLNYVKGPGSEIEDLYILAYTDTIIGSNSSFGAWASYYGNIPFIIFPEKI